MTEIRPGRYVGVSREISLALRLQTGPDGTISRLSGDVFRDQRFLASFVSGPPIRTNGGETAEASIEFRGVPQLKAGSFRMDVDERGLGSFELGVDLSGGHRDFFAGSLRWESRRLRKINIEIDGLVGMLPPVGYVTTSGEEMTIEKAFQHAGFDVTVDVDAFTASDFTMTRLRGWTAAEMHAAMEITRKRVIPGTLQTHVFVASYMAGRDNRGVLGIMFDWGDADLNGRPREGVTIFHDHPMLSDPRFPEDARRRDYIFTAVHEIGHALNLLHSFDKSRPSALSWMNYPGLFPFGQEAPRGYDGSIEFWNAFTGEFDEEEMQHLLHATPREILPGGFPFGMYEEGLSKPFGGLADPRLAAPGANPLRATSAVELLLEPLKPTYELGEPVLISVAVRNVGTQAVRVPRNLDPTEGNIRIEITRPNGQGMRYRPPVRLCKSASRVPLRPSQTLPGPSGTPIFLSADGPMFTEPGTYILHAQLTGVDGSDVAFSKPVKLVVEQPTDKIRQFSEKLWDNRRGLEALYLGHPAVDLDAWNALEDAVGTADLNKQRGNSMNSYFHYVAGLGWMTPFTQVGGRRELSTNLERAEEHFKQVEPRDLPWSAQNRIEALTGESKERARQYASAAVSGLTPTRPKEALRASIPPSGLFGHLGLKRPERAPDQRLSPFIRIADAFAGERRFADIVSWNIQTLHSEDDDHRYMAVAELMQAMRCDFWGLQEVDGEALAILRDILNDGGSVPYDFDVAEGAGRQCGCIFRIDTTNVRRLPLPNGLFDATIKTKARNGREVSRNVFFRRPYLAEVSVRQASGLSYDFRTAVVHLDSTDQSLEDTGNSIRTASTETLAAWVSKDRVATGERDYLILGDLNAGTALHGMAEFLKEGEDIALLSVGMQEKYGENQAITRVASRRPHDCIVVTGDAREHADPGEQIIVRSDQLLAEFSKDSSDTVPVAARFVMSNDTD